MPPKTPTAATDLADAVLTARARNKAAVSGTTLETTEGAVLEWLFSEADASTFGSFRARFDHGLRGVDSEGLAKLQAMLRQVAEAFWENDAKAISHAAELFYKYVGLETEQQRIRSAVQLVSDASERIRDGGDRTPLLVFSLGALDARFRTANAEAVKSVLLSVRHNNTAKSSGKAKGGAGNLSARGAAAKLMALTGAFDAPSVPTARKKIDTAFGALKKVARKPKTAARAR